MRPAALVLSALLTPTAAGAQPDAKACMSSLTASGVVARGAAVCDPAWLDRPSARKLGDAAGTCAARADARALRQQGADDFDRDLRDNGRDAACAALDGLLRKMD